MGDTTVIVRPGQVLFARNSDRDLAEAQLLEWHPRRRHAPGAALACTWITVPQAAETAAVLLSRPFWTWGAEMGTNEHGVVIGTEGVFTRRPRARIGLTGMDLVRLALERSDSAEAACAVIVAMLAAHGQGGGCGYEQPGFSCHNSFVVADAGGAFVLETAGPAWARERVTGVRSLSGALTIAGFAGQHAAPLRGHVAGNLSRRTWSLRHASAADPSPASLMRALREHGTRDGLPRYTWHNGGLHAPCVHAGGLLAGSQTAASWVAELRPGRAQHWVTATAAPCLGLFKPVAVASPVAPADMGPVPGARPSAALWWRHERLQRAVLRDPAAFMPAITGERDELEQRWLAEPPGSAAAFVEHHRRLDAWLARVSMTPAPLDRRPWWVRRFTAARDRVSGLTPRTGR
jgi:dipeptidase